MAEDTLYMRMAGKPRGARTTKVRRAENIVRCGGGVCAFGSVAGPKNDLEDPWGQRIKEHTKKDRKTTRNASMIPRTNTLANVRV